MFEVSEGKLIKWVDDKETEFGKRVRRYLYTGMRENKVEDIFERLLYILPDQLEIKELMTSPLDAFNPGMKLSGKKLIIYPRIVLDHVKYVSSIARFELGVEELFDKTLRDRSSLECDLILFPTEYWERRKGCEDPRIFSRDGEDHILYTAIGDWVYGDGRLKKVKIDALAYAKFEEGKLSRKRYILISDEEREFLTLSNKDACILEFRRKDASLLLRPELILRDVSTLENKVRICWKGKLDVEDMKVYEMEPAMGIERFEEKVGISANAIELGSDELLVCWHGKSIHDSFYRNGFAVVDREGNFLELTGYLLEPNKNNPLEMIGPYPGVIFPCGMVGYKEKIILAAGVADKRIGIYSAERDEILEKMKKV